MSSLKVFNGKEWIEIAKNGKDAVVDYARIVKEVVPLVPTIKGDKGDAGADGFVDEATVAYLEDRINSVEQEAKTPKWTNFGRVIREIQAGSNITVDNSDPNRPVISSTGGGAGAFTDLTDAPASYTGHASQFVKVNASETGVEFVAGSGSAVAWGDITGTLSNQTDLTSALSGKASSTHTHAESDITNLTTDLAAKVTGNTAITGATKTMITYDSKGLVTSGTDATTADIADSTNKRYVTDAQQTVLTNTSGTNTGDETTATIKSKLGITTLSGTNTGDQTSIVGITGTKAQFNTAVTDGDILYVGDVTSNATHTGDVTGATALTIDPTAITGKTLVTAVGSDYILISDTSDSGLLKKALASDLAGAGGATNLTYTASTRVIASDTGTDATLPLVSSTDAGLAPASGGGTSNFLRADGTWAAPSGSSADYTMWALRGGFY